MSESESVPEQPARKKPARGVYLLPNMLTTVGMFLGFLAIVWSANARFEAAGMAILIAALMDGLDGKVARLTHTSSEFGVQYDSLADLVAFGMAPAFLFWHWQLFNLGRVGIAAAFIYTACGALRLARFNVGAATTSKRFFIGLPIPAAGCTLVTFVFFANALTFLKPIMPYCAFVIAIFIGLLMVSRIRYFSFKEYDFLTAHPLRVMLAFLFLLALVVSLPRVFGFIYCALYIAWGLAYSFGLPGRRLFRFSERQK